MSCILAHVQDMELPTHIMTLACLGLPVFDRFAARGADNSRKRQAIQKTRSARREVGSTSVPKRKRTSNIW